MVTATPRQFFTEHERASLDPLKTPRHIAVIPDGNRRWASDHHQSTVEGHRKGCDAVLDIVLAAKELSVKTITFYTFSTENWQRPPEEIESLMNLLIAYLEEETPRMVQNGIQFQTIGTLEKLRPDVQKRIAQTKEATQDQKEITFIMAINYGGRDEICRAATRLLREAKPDVEVSESLFAQYLDTHRYGDPQLLIRTSGEARISNFLIWQLSYTELYMTPTLWPDFKPSELLKSIIWYQEREQRKGR